MANLAIAVKGSDKIIHFIWNCEQSGNNFIGSNRKVMGLKVELFDLKWTNDMIGVTGDGYDKGMSDITEALTFEGYVITDRQSVNDAVKKLIAAKYPIDQELKLHGELADGTIDKQEWDEYRKFINDMKVRAAAFKNYHYPKALTYKVINIKEDLK